MKDLWTASALEEFEVPEVRIIERSPSGASAAGSTPPGGSTPPVAGENPTKTE
jgi:hypothetical protein